MKNSQKGSVALWIILIIVVILIGGGVYYVLNNQNGCSVTDSNGKTTHGSCPETAPGTIVTTAQSEYDKVGQAMKDVAATYQANPPSGYLAPLTIPNGYKPQPHPSLFKSNSAQYFYTTGKGVPADKNLIFEENDSSHGMFGNFDLYIAYANKISGVKVVQKFTYNGGNGEVLTYTSNPNTNYELSYDHNGRLLRITTENDASVTPDIIINLLKAMTVTK